MKISTFISCKDHGKYLSRAIDSILRQSVKPDELILIDDGSKDDSYNVMKRYGSMAKLIYHPVCKGNIASYNEGIQNCNGDIIHLMAADDVLLYSDIYKLCLEYLGNDEVAFCTVGINHIDEKGDLMDTKALPPFNGVATAKEIISAMANVGNFINGGCTLIKTAVQKEVGPYDSDLPYSADFANWIRVAALGYSGAFIQRPLYGYRQHSGAMTHSKSAPVKERQQCANEIMKAMEKYGL